jgi:hypothetical protein
MDEPAIYHTKDDLKLNYRASSSTKANTGSNCCTLVLNLMVPITLVTCGIILLLNPTIQQKNDIRIAYLVIGIVTSIFCLCNVLLTIFFHIMDTINKGSLSFGLFFIPLSILNLLGPFMLFFGGIALIEEASVFSVGIASIVIGSLTIFCEFSVILMFGCVVIGSCGVIITSSFAKKKKKFLIEEEMSDGEK